MSVLPSTTLIVIPALNEQEALPGVLAELKHAMPSADVLVVDDGSTDDTARVAMLGGATVVSLPYNLGVGTALRTGFRYAARHGYQRVVQSDADGQHDPRSIQHLLDAMDGGSDMVIGSRFAAADGHYEVGGTRRSAMRVISTVLRLVLNRRFTDPTSGFRAFDRPIVELFATRYPREFLSDTVEAILLASYTGHRVTEVPVRMRPRAGGEASHRDLRLIYHYLRLLVAITITMSTSGRRAGRAET